VTHVSAVLNGGGFTVTTETMPLTEERPVVRLAVHDDRHLLQPDVARRLTVALIEAAGCEERPETGDWP
jgi:hypothetical protein